MARVKRVIHSLLLAVQQHKLGMALAGGRRGDRVPVPEVVDELQL